VGRRSEIQVGYNYFMVRRKRSQNEIMGLVLMLLRNGYTNKASIRQVLDIDVRTLNRALFTLKSNGLIMVEDDKYIRITDKGIYFSNLYKELMGLLGIDYNDYIDIDKS
jgi:predicted transcriptional regulator